MSMNNLRLEKGKKLAETVQEQEDGSHIVGKYTVQDFTCTCPDHVYRDGITCKHIYAVQIYEKVKCAVTAYDILEKMDKECLPWQTP